MAKPNNPQKQNSNRSVAGRLLLADPSLRGDMFSRSVIYMTEDDFEGSAGFILNQPTGKTVRDFLEGGKYEALADIAVYRGGPVAIDRLTFAVMGWDRPAGRFSFSPRVAAHEAGDGFRKGMDVRAYVGYSGWGMGQLRDELERNSWIVAEPPSALAEPDSLADLWRLVLRGMSPLHALMAETPAEPGLN